MQLIEAALLSTSFEAILYGLSVFLFMLTLWVLLRNRKERRVNWAMVSASSALLLLSTMEMVVNILRLYLGFVHEGPGLPGGPEDFFGDVSRVSFVIKNTLYNAQTLILDGVVIYRTYKVWNNVLVIVVPTVGWLGLLASSAGLGYALATSSMGESEGIFAAEPSHWLTANWCVTLVTNVCATFALAYRIWQVTSRSAEYKTGGCLSPILRVIIESGALYSFTMTAALILFLVRSNGVYVILDMISPIICIVFNMIIVRIGLAADGALLPEPTRPVPPPGQAESSIIPTMRRMIRRQTERDLEMKDINITVEIAQFVHDDSESRISQEDGPKSDRIGSPSSATAVTVASRRTLDGGVSRSLGPQVSDSQVHIVAL
ncbi:hypothetical protein C8Q70DRAFT_82925 [Cubamyces menziesii]|uniref:Uncharacterized protein n=1 Tax=Trametes cubensis TaxID=1111947 RepID=A0AAD7XGH1_9APHY|nr:hypothetical protein C8Q70DRAFT_82925 [Cubamyces menziesii]KAJ8497017.1 hypothetical protein ONZ51_g760 [Trametes cubensis]